MEFKKIKEEVPVIQEGCSAWYGPEVAAKAESWRFTLTSEELQELQFAADKFVKLGNGVLSPEHLQDLSNFKIPLVSKKCKLILKQLHNGIGFFVWRGIPVHVWSRERSTAAFLIVGRCLGNLRKQNPAGEILGHVVDLGLSDKNPNIRVHQVSGRLTFHADSCDVVGLLCNNAAKSGGESLLVSSVTIYNEMLKRNPQLAYELFTPLATDRRGDVIPGKLPYYLLPVFVYHQGLLSTMYQRQYTESAQRFPEAPRLTQAHREAMDLFDSLANDPKLNFGMDLFPGDMQFLHNHTILHDRTVYVDWPEGNRKRHMLRIWIATEGARPLPAICEGRFGSVEVGNRGGPFNIDGVEPSIPLHY